MSERKIIYLGFAFSHHRNTHAGYDKISNYLPYNKKISCQRYLDNCNSTTLFRRIVQKLNRTLFNIAEIPYYFIYVIWKSFFSSNNVFHFIYGENTFFSLPKFCLRKNNRFVCTFHQPFEWFQNNPRFIKHIKNLDAIILVGNSEIKKFESMTGKKNVVFIPHGICTEFYKPEHDIKKEHMLLTVGNWLRDYDFANKVYQQLLIDDSSLVINVVANEENQKHITKHPRIHFHNGISDEQLKKLYCQCSVLYLPLIRYTANNAILEAGATGCNIVISSDYPDNSYIPEQFITLSNMDVENAVKKIKSSLKNNYNYDLSAYVSENFSWEKIAQRTEAFLRDLQ